MTTLREFTLAEANDLVPELHRRVGQQLRLQAEVEQTIKQLVETLGHLPRDLTPQEEDTEEIVGLKTAINELLAKVDQGWNDVAELGCVVKDPRLGLVDFAGRVEGQLVWLCWRYGEESIAHYHGFEEGFSGRKPLPGASRHKLLN